MREDVKDLLDRAAGWYSPPPIRAEEVRARGERRRRPGRVVAAAVALTVFAAAGALTWTAFRPQRTGVGEEPVIQDVSATVLGVSVTYPEDWTLVDLWPLARSIASWPDPIGTSISVPEGTSERGGLPLLQLSNVDLGLRSACGAETTTDEAVLYVAVNGGPYLLAEDGTARWSGAPTQDDGPCGPGWYAYRHSTEDNGDGTTGERPYLVFARFGPDASAEDRRVVFDAYDSLSFAPADILHPSVEESPWYVTPSTIRVSEGPGTRCIQATTSGDLDGDGTMDHAEFVEVVSVGISCDRPGRVFQNLASQELVIRFGSGQTVELPFTDCQGGLCAYVFEAVDLDGDGRDELAIDVSSGGATGLEEFYRVDPDTIQPLVIADSGDPPYVEPGPAILGGGFDSVLQSPVVCGVNGDGTRELVSIHAENVGDSLSGPWQVHTTTMVLRGDRLVVTSTEDSESSFPGTSGIPSFAETVPLETECS